MRRLFRWLFNGLGKALCLLSLLACVGVGWLWWRGKGPDPHWVEVSVLRRDVWVVSYSDGLSVRVVGRWPGGAGAWAGGMLHDAFPSYKLASKRPSVAPLGPTWRWGNSKVWLESGQLQFHLRPDGTPERLSLLRWFKFKAALLDDLDDRRSEPLPYWEANGVPHWLALTALAVPRCSGSASAAADAAAACWACCFGVAAASACACAADTT